MHKVDGVRSDDKYLFLGIGIIVAWAALVSSDAMKNVIPYGVVSGTFDFLRTAAAVATGFIAYFAFQKWRRPDDAKRRADTAQMLLRLSQKLETTALSVRIENYIIHFDSAPFTLEDKIAAVADMASNKSNAVALKKLKRELDEFHTYRTEATVLFKRVNAATLMDAV